ncbi:LytR/AlgR family response regulator transcription factor [Bernardetia sp. OM2101]|uniref:LytR/AlgR family response regulator transcription factor n=1 Tax=Bernardetia sp. OM2101 TaxID=3344876 RepID=UPI0035D0558F
MRIIVVEDEPLYASRIEFLIEKMGYELVGMTDNAEEMMQFFMTKNPDLALIDININGSMNGIELAKKIWRSKYETPVIFITSFDDTETFSKAKLVNPFAYIIKPIDEATLQRSVELALMRYSNNDMSEGQVWRNDILLREHIFIKDKGKLKKITLKDIIVIEAANKYVDISTKTNKFVVRMSLRDIETKLPPSDFVQIHRSIIINAHFIEDIDPKENTIYLLNRTFDIGRSYRENLLQRLNIWS